jgi:hypothetical protein
MMQYDGDLLLPANYLVPPPEIHKTSGEYLAHNGISTFACSETQKFGHVTFFWNGNRSGYFDSKLETYLEVRACVWGVACVCGGGCVCVSVCVGFLKEGVLGGGWGHRSGLWDVNAAMCQPCVCKCVCVCDSGWQCFRA